MKTLSLCTKVFTRLGLIALLAGAIGYLVGRRVGRRGR